jgi:hypothetical protein
MGKRKNKIKLRTTFSREDHVRWIGPFYPCARCKRKKPAELMIHARLRGTNHHVGSWCKDCHKAYMKQYRLEHKDQILIAQRVAYRRRQAAKFNDNDKLG